MRKDNLLVTGCGSLATQMIHQLKDKYNKIVVMARGEEKIYNIPSWAIGEIGDVRDLNTINRVMDQHDIDICYHTAALKVLNLIEHFPMEVVRTNIIGSDNVARAAVNNGLKKCILVSTDKSVHPHPSQNYGASKLIARSIYIDYAHRYPNTNFSIVLYGNVLYSRNSFLHYWVDKINNDEPITITHKDCTRFFWTVDESVSFIDNVCDLSQSGLTYVPLMKSYKIDQIADALGVILNKKVKKVYSKLREGEKIHEQMISELEIDRTYYVCDDIVCIKPPYFIKNYDGLDKKYTGPLISSDNMLNDNMDDLVKLITQDINLV
jgi:UDP-N-acetylglucosamine 4,6-dehydratase/5-epimerase